MEDWSQCIGQAKSAMDNGFSRVGPKLRADSSVDAVLSGGAGRIVRLANAVALLCRNQHAEECLPLLRALISVAMTMRWIATVEDEECAAFLRHEPQSLDWSLLCAEPRWGARLSQAGVGESEWKAMQKSLAVDAEATLSGSGLPWSHVFKSRKEPLTQEEALQWAARAMGQALLALDARWPGAFPGAKEMGGV